MISITYIYDTECEARRQGIFARATELDARVLSFQPGLLNMGVRDIIKMTKPDACIVESEHIDANRLLPEDFDTPVVVCDIPQSQIEAGFTGIKYDREIAARRAMDALFELRLEHYAFAGYHRPSEWSSLRENVFTDMVTARGMTPLTFTFSRRKKLPEYMTLLENWLLSLPRPCGIFAVNDEIGDYVLTCADKLGIQVPESLAVIGVDNDISRCENTSPPLASIQQDYTRSGRLAVDLVMTMLGGDPSVLPQPVSYGAGVAVLRGSLKRFRQHDSAAAKALDYIRMHAADRGIGLNSVARVMKMPLSTARLRFQRHTGHSIFEEIEDQRFLLACSLLQNRDEKISNIHEACGYGCARALRNVFVKRTGFTPSEWRAHHT